VFDDDYRRVRHIDADFDHRRRHQKACLAIGKGGHRAVLVGRLHAVVDQPDAAGKERRQCPMALLDRGEIGGLRLLDHRADPIDLGVRRERSADRGHDIVEAFERHGSGIDGMPSRRLLGQARDVEVAIGGHHRLARTPRRRRNLDQFIAEVNNLSPGDLVVHADHGIGRYEALETIDVAGAPHDCLRVLYAGDDKLFVPIENIEVLSRFGSEDGDLTPEKLLARSRLPLAWHDQRIVLGFG
jgi:hypothetical protein